MELQRRVVCGYRFERTGRLVFDRDSHGALATEELVDVDGHRIEGGPFCRFLLEDAPAAGGAYVITVDDRVVYAGQATNLATRFGHTGYGAPQRPNSAGPQSTNRRVNRQILVAVERGEQIDVWFHKTDARERVENWLLWTLDLPWNEAGPTLPLDEVHRLAPRPDHRTVAASARRAAAMFQSKRAESLRMFAELRDKHPTDGIVYLRRAEAHEANGEHLAALCDFAVARAFLPIEQYQQEAEVGLRRVIDNLRR